MRDDGRQPPQQRPSWEQTDPYDPREQGYAPGWGGPHDNAPTERIPPEATTPPWGTDQSPPPYAPDAAQYLRSQYPGGQPGQWPAPYGPPTHQPARPPAHQPPAAPPLPRRYREAAAVPASPAPRYQAPAPARQRAPAPSLPLPRFHIAHVFLALGLAAMAYAISQPWGSTAAGAQVFVRSFTSPRLSGQVNADFGVLAQQLAWGIVIAAAVLSVALVLVNLVVTLMNRALGFIGLAGCASLLLFPVLGLVACLLFVVLLAGAGFGGLGIASNLPAVQQYGFSNISVQQPALGFYLWWAGLVVLFVGMLGELMMRRR